MLSSKIDFYVHIWPRVFVERGYFEIETESSAHTHTRAQTHTHHKIKPNLVLTRSKAV